jgi:hypothetical protein
MLRKVKAVGMYLMKACRGDYTIAALIINLGARWRFVVIVTPRPLCHRGKNLRFSSSTVYYSWQYLSPFRFDTKVLSGGRQKFCSGATVTFRGSACGCYGGRGGEYIFGALGRVVPLIPKTPDSAEVTPDPEFVGSRILSKFCSS